MNYLSSHTLKKANRQAIYNLYLYLIHKAFPKQNETLQSAVDSLGLTYLNDADIKKLNIIKSALKNDSFLAFSKINRFTYSKSGLTACVFNCPTGETSVAFKGTGTGEWIDNGEGLSGIPEENTYITYLNGVEIYQTVQNDYATDQQVEALNWFLEIADENGWNKNSAISVSGHSKGGNKAQFVAIHSDLVNKCYSFNGQGFSPEALRQLKNLYGKDYNFKRQKIISICADNDYVNVLGARLVPENQIYYFKSEPTFHPIESMLDDNGHINTQSEQGNLSLYVQAASNELMQLSPAKRRYVMLGVMNIFQKYLGDSPINGDFVSLEETIAGIGLAVAHLLRKFTNNN